MPRQGSPDAYARSLGFKDAATMTAYYQRQHEMAGAAQVGPGTSGVVTNALNQPVATAQSAISWHPALLLQHVLDRLNSVIP